jgi:hypothetical protein
VTTTKTASPRFALVSFEEQHQHVALPKLYGAPAYARPTPIVAQTPRPPDLDDLPLSAFQTADERRLAEALPARPYRGVPPVAGEGYVSPVNGERAMLRGRPFRLRALAGRLLRGD